MKEQIETMRYLLRRIIRTELEHNSVELCSLKPIQVLEHYAAILSKDNKDYKFKYLKLKISKINSPVF
jgi:hypothetical protein